MYSHTYNRRSLIGFSLVRRRFFMGHPPSPTHNGIDRFVFVFFLPHCSRWVQRGKRDQKEQAVNGSNAFAFLFEFDDWDRLSSWKRKIKGSPSTVGFSRSCAPRQLSPCNLIWKLFSSSRVLIPLITDLQFDSRAGIRQNRSAASSAVNAESIISAACKWVSTRRKSGLTNCKSPLFLSMENTLIVLLWAMQIIIYFVAI